MLRTAFQNPLRVFQSDAKDTGTLEQQITRAVARALGLKTAVFLRSAKEWRALAAANPFREEARKDPAHMVVMVMGAEPEPDRITALKDAISGRELVHAVGRELFLVYPDGIGRSRLTNLRIEKTLRVFWDLPKLEHRAQAPRPRGGVTATLSWRPRR